MKSPAVTLADWRAQVEKELAGVAFDKALVQVTPEGLALQPLYTETEVDPGLPGRAPFVRGGTAEARPFKLCVRVDPPDRRQPGALLEELDGGADAVWTMMGDAEADDMARARGITVV